MAHDYAGVLLFDQINTRHATDTTDMQVWCAHYETRCVFVLAQGPVVLFDYTKKGGTGMAPPGFNSAMPGFGEDLKDREIWAVLAFIKSRWPREVLARQRQITARSR